MTRPAGKVLSGKEIKHNKKSERSKELRSQKKRGKWS